MEERLEQFVVQVAKAELHLHLEGCIRLDTLWQLAQENQVQIPDVSCKKDLERLYQIESLDQFVYFFIHVLQPCIRRAEDIRCCFADLRDYMQRNRVRYAELFFSPSKLLDQGIAYGDIARILQEGSEELAHEGYICRFLIDVSRSFGPENAMRNLEHVLFCPCKAIIGIGLGGSEKDGPARVYAEVFRKAREAGLRCVAHAGEDVGPESIWESINLLKAERIGHGTSSMHDAELRSEIKRRGIPLEVCITSNTFTRRFVSVAAEHPVRLFYDESLPLTLNSDDPALFGSELNDEYRILVEQCGFGACDVLGIMENNVRMSFMPQHNQERFIQNIRSTARECGIL